jgi:23S rRNA (guanosine2251-2'-O)-methyltransferase
MNPYKKQRKPRELDKSGDGVRLPFKYTPLAELIKAAKSKENALVVVLDHITDVGNFGAIIRTAEVVGAAGVVIPSHRGARVVEGTYRTSAGAVELLPIASEPNLVQALDTLKEAGFWVGAASEHAAQDIWGCKLAGRFALVMGAEDKGVSRLVAEHCDFDFKLPQAGQTESLNVSAACAAICYEWMRQCQ